MIKTLAKSLGKHKSESILAVFLAVLEVIFEIIIPLVMSNIIDYGIEMGAMDVVVKYAIWLLVFAILELISGFAGARVAANAFAANLR